MLFRPSALIYLLLTATPGLALAQGVVAGEFLSFNGIYEPSGLAYLGEGEFAVVEDEPGRPLHRVKLDNNGRLQELGELKIIGGGIPLNDLEGVAFDGVHLYAVTSHSNISKTDEGKNRMELVRFEYHNGNLLELQRVVDLKALLVSLLFARIKNKSRKKIRRKINIEALAWSPHSKSLYIGLRNPRNKGKSAVLEIVHPDVMFMQGSTKNVQVRMHWLDLGGKGIRSMNWDNGLKGLSIVTGGKKTGGEGFSLWYWPGDLDSSTKRISDPNKPLPPGTEGLSLFSMGDHSGMLVVIDDGDKNQSVPAHYQLFDFSRMQ